MDTIATLTEPARGMTKLVLENATSMFAGNGEIDPCIFIIKPDGEIDTFESKSMMNDEMKPFLWAGVRELRRHIPVVGFISEVWMVKGKGKESLDDLTKVMPRNHPDKIEVAMFQLWDGARAVTFMADIKREPNSLGEWEVFFDSHFPKDKMESLGGAMMEGEPCAQEGN